MILVILFIVFSLAGLLWGFSQRNKGVVHLNNYHGEFKAYFLEAQDFLRRQYQIDFKLNVCDDDRVSGLTYSAFGKPVIMINEGNCRDAGWLKDFSLIAEIMGKPKLEDSKELAAFLLFHEFRHIMQDRKLCVLQSYPEDERIRHIIAYHKLPREMDADIFGVLNLGYFKAGMMAREAEDIKNKVWEKVDNDIVKHILKLMLMKGVK